MATTRADTFTATKKQLEYYSDFRDDFAIDNLTGDLLILTNEQSVNQSLSNLILRAPEEVPYEPEGSISQKILFEQVDTITSAFLQQTINFTIKNYEPRVTNVNVLVEPLPDQYSYNVVISYQMINTPQVYTFSQILTRVR